MVTDVWPDPSGWVARLAEKLVRLDTQYYGFNMIRRMQADPDDFDNPHVIEGDPQANATLTAAAALGAVIAALKEIPTFHGNVGVQALTDVANAMLDLDQGLRPGLLQPRPGSVITTDHSGRQTLKAHVVLCVELLELAGYSSTSAHKAIANIFTDAGFSGRKRSGAGLSWKTIYEWSGALAAHGADAEGRRMIDQAIAQWRAMRTWPPIADQVLAFALQLAEEPALRTSI